MHDGAGAGEAKRVRHTLVLDAAILDRTKNAAAALAGAPLYLNLGRLVDRALAAELRRLEQRFNSGRPFSPRPRPLRGGRAAGRKVRA